MSANYDPCLERKHKDYSPTSAPDNATWEPTKEKSVLLLVCNNNAIMYSQECTGPSLKINQYVYNLNTT
jgi:hypothetical protein